MIFRKLFIYVCADKNATLAIFAEKISLTLTALASPFLEFLQFTLSIDDFENSIVLDMTTEFIAAFCSILSRYQKVETTKRVLAAIWFVYSLVLGTGKLVMNFSTGPYLKILLNCR